MDQKTLNNRVLKTLVEVNSRKDFKNKNLFDSLDHVKLTKIMEKVGKKSKSTNILYGPDVTKGKIVKYSLLGKHKRFERSHIKEQRREQEDLGMRIKFGLLK